MVQQRCSNAMKSGESSRRLLLVKHSVLQEICKLQQATAREPCFSDKEEVPGSSPGRPTFKTPAKGHNLFEHEEGWEAFPSPFTATVLQPGRSGITARPRAPLPSH